MTSGFLQENPPSTVNTNRSGRIRVVWSAVGLVEADDDAAGDSILTTICIFHRIFVEFVQKSLDLTKKTSNRHLIFAKLMRSKQKYTKSSLESSKNSLESAKTSRSAPKIVKISLDLLKSHRISPNMVEISLGSPRMSPDLTKSLLDLPNYCWICI